MKNLIKKIKIHQIPKNVPSKSFTLLLIILFFSSICIPTLSFRTANIFFGQVRILYNLNLSQFFYKRASYPLFSLKPPHYAHYQLSRTYFIQGELWKALDEAKEELITYPEDTTTYYIIGLTYGYLGLNHEAIEAFSVYIDTHPETWAGRNDKAWLQFKIGDIDGAIQTIKPIAENFRYTPWVQNTYCALLVTKKDITEAEKVCTQAKKIIDNMTDKDWGHAYPGNDPDVYHQGLLAMRKSIEENITLLEKESVHKKK